MFSEVDEIRPQASVVKGNPVEVVVDHDKPGDVAIEVRLTTAR